MLVALRLHRVQLSDDSGLDAVLTSARCCLLVAAPAQLRLHGAPVDTYGIHVTIGASHVPNTREYIRGAGPPVIPVGVGTYYEFFKMDPERIFIPPEYFQIAAGPGPSIYEPPMGAEWGICLIKIQQEYHTVPLSGRRTEPKATIPHIGKTSPSFKTVNALKGSTNLSPLMHMQYSPSMHSESIQMLRQAKKLQPWAGVRKMTATTTNQSAPFAH